MSYINTIIRTYTTFKTSNVHLCHVIISNDAPCALVYVVFHTYVYEMTVATTYVCDL